MGYGWLNLGSVALGLAGWIAPWLAFAGRGRSGPGRRGLWHIVSLACCALALWFQLCYQRHLVDIQDWSALLDTAGAVVKVSGFLLLTTLLDNLAALALSGAAAEEETTERRDPAGPGGTI